MPPEISQYQHGKVPRDVRRAQIAALAEELFAERGYRGASMDELARRAGVTKPVIYEIFGSKDGLYRACVERTAEQLGARVTDAVATATLPMDKLRAGAVAFFGFAAEQRRAWEILYSGDGRFASAIDGVRQRQAQVVTALMGEIAGQLDVRADRREIEAAAQAVNGACEALATWSEPHTDLSPEDLADLVVRIVGPGLIAMTTTATGSEEHPNP